VDDLKATHNNLLCIAGPTAVGKSATALRLAEELNGEIVSFDSMQVYEGIQIGVAKPSEEELQRVPHHLVGFVPLTQKFSVADFLSAARKVVQEIQSKKRLPILCGGTGLYFRAFFEGLGEAPPSDPTLRQTLESKPLEELVAELKTVDPVTHESIDLQNPRRVVRALEVCLLTGKPFSQQRAEWERGTESGTENGTTSHQAQNPTQPQIFTLTRNRDDLRDRIDRRVDQMIEEGLVEETRRLMNEYQDEWALTAMQAIGYRQIIQHLKGATTLEAAIQDIKTRTWQFAKRQKTWFRNQMPTTWIELAADQVEATEQIRAQLP
jgi:tRNA dimethylallyltransferase